MRVRLYVEHLHGDGARGNDRQMNAEPQLRRGTGADADIAAEVYLRARHHAVPEIPPLAHRDDEVRHWMHRVLDEHEAWLAVADDGTLLGLMVLDSDWVEQLYIDPAWSGRGLGTRLVELAKQSRPGGLQLWTFVSNVRAQRFYERHGFTVEECTDGSGNEEKAPDLRYVWRPSAPQDLAGVTDSRTRIGNALAG
jgi:ribosomal protein S18 acetylase RimI-like enzyme